MKLKVLKSFSDKETGQVYKVGDEIEVSTKRGNEILSSRYEVAEMVNGVIELDGEPIAEQIENTEPKKRSRKSK